MVTSCFCKVLLANSSGASFATKEQGNITLNGSRSNDPYSTEARPLTFTWFCRRSHETLPENYSLPVVDAPNDNASLLGGCFGYGPGRLSRRENVINVEVDKMEEKQTYVFELLVSNSVKSSRAIHWLLVKNQLQASYFIR